MSGATSVTAADPTDGPNVPSRPDMPMLQERTLAENGADAGRLRRPGRRAGAHDLRTQEGEVVGVPVRVQAPGTGS
jgi:hypothetical protein